MTQDYTIKIEDILEMRKRLPPRRRLVISEYVNKTITCEDGIERDILCYNVKVSQNDVLIIVHPDIYTEHKAMFSNIPQASNDDFLRLSDEMVKQHFTPRLNI